VHRIDEGYVGVYYRGGRLLSSFTEPGFALKIPVLTTMEQVQVTIQTDAVTNIPCGTSGGVLIEFGKIEVVNRLSKTHVLDTVRNYTAEYDKLWIFDRVHHEINQFCSVHSLQEVYIDKFDTLDEELQKALTVAINKYCPGLEIMSVRVTKPQIPSGIARNYELMEAEKTKFKVAAQNQKVVEREAQTEREKAKIEAEKVAAVNVINMERVIAEKVARKELEQITSEMHVAKSKALADAEFYKVSKQAESNKEKLTREFVSLEMFKYATENATLYFGDALPSVFLNSNTLPNAMSSSRL
jgi:regulator of protease activity HflC (stomatin/prohibitin superfamily)